MGRGEGMDAGEVDQRGGGEKGVALAGGDGMQEKTMTAAAQAARTAMGKKMRR